MAAPGDASAQTQPATIATRIMVPAILLAFPGKIGITALIAALLLRAYTRTR
jgi:hypothetical protein